MTDKPKKWTLKEALRNSSISSGGYHIDTILNCFENNLSVIDYLEEDNLFLLEKNKELEKKLASSQFTKSGVTWASYKAVKDENKALKEEKKVAISFCNRSLKLKNKELEKGFDVLSNIVKSIKSHLDILMHGDVRARKMSAIYLMTEKALSNQSVIAVQNRDKGE